MTIGKVKTMRKKYRIGIIISKQIARSKPPHPCITVYYPREGMLWDIAESLVEVISECK